jgi:ketosteroid isomerase-like protein
MTVEDSERALNQLIQEGKVMEAFEKFYSDDIVMQENLAPGTRGKEANRRREHQMIETFHGATLHAYAVNEDVSFSEWTFDLTLKSGQRIQLSEVTRRRWRDGKVAEERFYYDSAG